MAVPANKVPGEEITAAHINALATLLNSLETLVNTHTGQISANSTAISSHSVGIQANANELMNKETIVYYNVDTSSWPSRPSGAPAGITWRSTYAVNAAAPTGRVTGDLWDRHPDSTITG